ncbi:beta-3-deoxy-D-manno-oct-2-ulosonic acid transferase [Janthinobacterium sp. 17J80-10]|nr:beta-3-deoxy-D-manno-oct-2-ulosonic acid transferase [Janthinobacterium sp. 17J80-10]
MAASPKAAARPRLSAPLFAYGFSIRKRSLLRRFTGVTDIRFIYNPKQISPGNTLLLWGSRPRPIGLSEGVNIVRLEDGFLRSVGLGADLIAPLSWVIDSRGIYYDPAQPSDLEHLLQSIDFENELLQRAAVLRQRIVASGLTKYNVGHGGWRRPAAHRVVLVPGQVETDASIRCGAPAICTNLGLLQAVRTANPDAYIVYKPHPDVLAGLRASGQQEDEAHKWCDEVVTGASMDEMFAGVDEVHVMTSLTGFEALMRGKKVACYGQPFYAGWGLTLDMVPVARRMRRLSLDALVAGALILYPVYVSRSTGQFIAPEQALDELLAWREQETGRSWPWWRKGLRMILKIWGARR